MKKRVFIIACVVVSLVIGALIYVSVNYNESHILSKSLYSTTENLAVNN